MLAATKLLDRIGRRRALLLVGLAAAAATFAGWNALQTKPVAAPQLVAQADAPATSTVLVFVSGAVEHPGLYELSPDTRIADAIAAAGGITPLADLGKLPNLASRVHDGRQVNVPFRKSSGTTLVKLDINTAAVDELAAVPGMPPGLAEEIVQFRTTWGPFQTLIQLKTDLGVDSATVTGLRQYLRVVPEQP